MVGAESSMPLRHDRTRRLTGRDGRCVPVRQEGGVMVGMHVLSDDETLVARMAPSFSRGWENGYLKKMRRQYIFDLGQASARAVRCRDRRLCSAAACVALAVGREMSAAASRGAMVTVGLLRISHLARATAVCAGGWRVSWPRAGRAGRGWSTGDEAGGCRPEGGGRGERCHRRGAGADDAAHGRVLERKKAGRKNGKGPVLRLGPWCPGRPCVARTRDQRIKSPLLYQLS